MSINKVELVGNLTRDPELQVTKGGTPVLKFGIAVGESGKNGKDYTNFFGSLHYSSWSDPKTGYKRSKVEVYVRELETMGPAPTKDASEYASGQQIPLAAAPPQVPAEVYDEDIPF